MNRDDEQNIRNSYTEEQSSENAHTSEIKLSKDNKQIQELLNLSEKMLFRLLQYGAMAQHTSISPLQMALCRKTER